mmetsp:Transcript_46353/g.96957  ORF Transcript_46353/g.96957 Transcript_46353/m.96957 type:complete len:332 (+) Transcript_46353:422-1417(+)
MGLDELADVVEGDGDRLALDAARAGLDDLHEHLEDLHVLLLELVRVLLPEGRRAVHRRPLQLPREHLLAVLVEVGPPLHVLRHLLQEEGQVRRDILVRPRPLPHVLQQLVAPAHGEEVLHVALLDQVHQRAQDHPDHLLLLHELERVREDRRKLEVGEARLEVGGEGQQPHAVAHLVHELGVGGLGLDEGQQDLHALLIVEGRAPARVPQQPLQDADDGDEAELLVLGLLLGLAADEVHEEADRLRGRVEPRPHEVHAHVARPRHRQLVRPGHDGGDDGEGVEGGAGQGLEEARNVLALLHELVEGGDEVLRRLLARDPLEGGEESLTEGG